MANLKAILNLLYSLLPLSNFVIALKINSLKITAAVKTRRPAGTEGDRVCLAICKSFISKELSLSNLSGKSLETPTHRASLFYLTDFRALIANRFFSGEVV
jgi:hypothetical protein